MTGAQKLARLKLLIAAHGEYVTVSRRPETTGGVPTTQTLRCLPQPLSQAQGAMLAVEGALNIGEDNPYDFVFAGDADVREAIDMVTFQGSQWRVLNTNPGRDKGVSFSIHLFCVRYRSG